MEHLGNIWIQADIHQFFQSEPISTEEKTTILTETSLTSNSFAESTSECVKIWATFFSPKNRNKVGSLLIINEVLGPQ